MIDYVGFIPIRRDAKTGCVNSSDKEIRYTVEDCIELADQHQKDNPAISIVRVRIQEISGGEKYRCLHCGRWSSLERDGLTLEQLAKHHAPNCERILFRRLRVM